MTPDLPQRLVVLAEVAAAGSLTGAARRLGVVPSAISHHLAVLERMLGVTLLRCVGRGVVLTPIGEELAARGRAIAREAEAAGAAVREGEAPRGHLRLGMPAGIADALVVPLLARFLDAHPGLTVEAVAHDGLADLAADQLDAAFRVGSVQDGPFVARRLHTGCDIFVAAPGLLARLPHIAAPRDLVGLPFIGFTAFGRQPTFLIEGEDGSRAEIEVSCRVTTSNGLAIRHWAVTGAGLARLPDFAVAEELADGRLVRVLPGPRCRPALVVRALPARTAAAGQYRRLIAFSLAQFDRPASPSRPSGMSPGSRSG